MGQSFWFKTKDYTDLYIKRWSTENAKPKAIIQISHGMAEHIERYDSFATFLTNKGFTVYGNDHRGHGQTGLKQGLLGYFDQNSGFFKVVNDLHQINVHIKEEHPHVPIFLFGHSMGSFIARNFIQQYSHSISGVILSGTGYYPDSITLPGKLLSMLLPSKKPSKIMNRLAFGNYNKRVTGHKTAYDWISSDELEVEKYLKDPLSGFIPTARFFYDLMSGLNQMQKQNHSIRKDLSMLFISGSDDPVGNYEKGVWKSVQLYRDVGIKSIDTHLFKGARHEVLNDSVKEEAHSVIYNWINQQLSNINHS